MAPALDVPPDEALAGDDAVAGDEGLSPDEAVAGDDALDELLLPPELHATRLTVKANATNTALNGLILFIMYNLAMFDMCPDIAARRGW